MGVTIQPPERKTNAVRAAEPQVAAPRENERPKKRAVTILRERRKSFPDRSVTNLKETIDRLEGELREREDEKNGTLQPTGDRLSRFQQRDAAASLFNWSTQQWIPFTAWVLPTPSYDFICRRRVCRVRRRQAAAGRSSSRGRRTRTGTNLSLQRHYGQRSWLFMRWTMTRPRCSFSAHMGAG